MNPYEPPAADVDLRERPKSVRRIDFPAIFFAGAIYLLASYLFTRMYETEVISQRGVGGVFATICLIGPSLAGASCLTWLSRSGWWWLNGMIFSVIPVVATLGTLYLDSTNGRSLDIVVVLAAALFLMIISAPLTLTIIAINRLLVRILRMG